MKLQIITNNIMTEGMMMFSSTSDSSSYKTTTTNQNGIIEKSSPFRVIGIALVVDKLGKGPKMVFRYPTSSSSAAATTTVSSSDILHDGTSTTAGTKTNLSNPSSSGSSSLLRPPGKSQIGIASPSQVEEQEDLFFRLPPRQMAKLFRPKPALCGQPMTLSVGGTIFCCCAVLMDANDTETEDTTKSDNSNTGPLVLFSIIVALSPQIKSNSVTAGRERGNKNYDKVFDDDIYIVEEGKDSGASVQSGSKAVQRGGGDSSNSSASFLSIRRVHVSLARLCRILEREERRCHYISIQTDNFEKIRHEIYNKWRNTASSLSTLSPSPNDTEMGGTTERNTNSVLATPSSHSTSPRSIASAKATLQSANTSSSSTSAINLHRRANSAAVIFNSTTNHHENTMKTPGNSLLVSSSENQTSTSASSPLREDEITTRWLEQEQEILETIMAASSSSAALRNNESDYDNYDDNNDDGIEHQGNLARELVQVFHAMTRNDYDFPSTPSMFLSGRDSVVYINRHIAVAIDSVASTSSSSALSSNDNKYDNTTTNRVRPYHTLLFPSVTPEQLLESMSSSRSVFPRRLQQLLRFVSPQKSLTEISVDARLPLRTTIDLASYLVGQGACWVIPKLTKKTRFAVPQISRIRTVALSFSQQFGTGISLFVLISFLTESNSTFAETMVSMASTTDPTIIALRKRLDDSLLPSQQPSRNNVDPDDTNDLLHANRVGYPEESVERDNNNPETYPSEARDQILFQMVVWLCSHKVLIPLQDYMVTTTPRSAIENKNSSNKGHKSSSLSDNNVQSNGNVGTAGSQGTDAIQRNNNSSSNNNFSLGSSRNVTATTGTATTGATTIINTTTSDEQLLQELYDNHCLNGTISLPACCWRIGIDHAKLMAFIRRTPTIRLMTRVPCPNDDDWSIYKV